MGFFSEYLHIEPSKYIPVRTSLNNRDADKTHMTNCSVGQIVAVGGHMRYATTAVLGFGTPMNYGVPIDKIMIDTLQQTHSSSLLEAVSYSPTQILA